MDYLTSFSQLFDSLLVLFCLSGNLTVFRLLDCIFDYLTVFSAIWLSFLSFDYLTIFSAIWLSFGFLTVFWLFGCLLAIWLSYLFNYLSAIWLSIPAIWLSVGFFFILDSLLAIWLSFGCLTFLWLFDCPFCYLTVFWLFNCLLAILERHYNRTRMALESH